MSTKSPIPVTLTPPAVPVAPTSRLAPSPTGALHLGNARTFLITWALARGRGWRLVLRIEDFDTPRVKPGAADALTRTLEWLGIDWDPPAAGPRENPLVQSHDLAPYIEAMHTLASRGLAYPCAMSRAQIETAASAPQEGAHETPFPSSLRSELAGQMFDFDQVNQAWTHANGEPPNWRFCTPPGPVQLIDGFAGPRSYDPSQIVGDFVLWTKRNQPSYQLAVVVDDLRQGITHVVRGDDLLDSAARQLLLIRALATAGQTSQREPLYIHLPLVLGTDGRRLAKRHGDTRIDRYREAGVPPAAVIGLIASWSIPGRPRKPLSAAEFKSAFDLGTMPPDPVTFTPEDDQWLLSNVPK